jgi:hypothetical protein
MAHDPDDPRLPDPLRSDLSDLYRADVSSSPPIDQAVLNRARAHLAGRKRLLLLRRVAGAAAAVLLIAAVTIPLLNRTDRHSRPHVAQRAGDVNADGVVDVRDALLVARGIDAKQTGWSSIADVNGDKTVDRRDVDAIAEIAVRLDQGVVR